MREGRQAERFPFSETEDKGEKSSLRFQIICLCADLYTKVKYVFLSKSRCLNTS